MGVESLAENTPNAPKFICPSPKVLDFNEKGLHWGSVVLDHVHAQKIAAVELKDQLIAKGNFGVFNFSKIQT
jgi:hypothetical protein